MRFSDSRRCALGIAAVVAILAGCSGSQRFAPSPSNLSAQYTTIDLTKGSAQYTIINLDRHGLGGTVNDTGVAPNNREWVAGAADAAGNKHERATLWRHGELIDLGTFGGPNGGAATVNDDGVVVGAAQAGRRDPLGEGWGFILTCKANGGPCQGAQNLLLAFEWKNGFLKQLPTLGGNNAWALSNNNRGETVGVTETALRPRCVAPQVLKFEAVVWGPRDGEVRELRPLKGDVIGAAFGNNDRGDATGGTGPTCGFSTANFVHAVLWKDNTPIDLGSLGGVMNNYGQAVNKHEQVTGISDLAGDTTGHAFLWQRGVLSDLGTLPGDVYSQGSAINDKGQVVGDSCDATGNCRAFIWQHGVMTDMNTLIEPSPIHLIWAKGNNSDGIIVGQAINRKTHQIFGFLAMPTSR